MWDYFWYTPLSYRQLIYDRLVAEYPEYIASKIPKEKLIELRNEIFKDEMEVIVENTTDEVADKIFNRTIFENYEGVDNEKINDALDYVFYLWCVANNIETNIDYAGENTKYVSTVNGVYYKQADVDTDGINELVIVTSIKDQNNAIVNTISIFKLDGVDINLVAYYDDFDNSKRFTGNFGFISDSTSNAMLFIQYKNISTFNENNKSIGIKNIGYDAIVHKNDYILTQNFARQFSFGEILDGSFSQITDYFYFIGSNESDYEEYFIFEESIKYY